MANNEGYTCRQMEQIKPRKNNEKTKEGHVSNDIITRNDNAFKLKTIFDTQNPEGLEKFHNFTPNR